MRQVLGNRRLISTLIFVTFFVASIFVVVSPANAIDSRNYSQAIDSCQDVESKLRSKTEEFTQKREKHLENYSQVSGLFTSITNRLKSAGYEVDLLVELQPGLDRRIVHFAEKSQVFLSEMNDASDSACRDRASFKQELEEARESLKDVQSSVSGIQDYIQQIVVKSIAGVVNSESD